MSWRAYLVRRLVLAVIVLAAVSVVTFIVARIVPSDPAALYVGPRPRKEQVVNSDSTGRFPSSTSRTSVTC